MPMTDTFQGQKINAKDLQGCALIISNGEIILANIFVTYFWLKDFSRFFIFFCQAQNKV